MSATIEVLNRKYTIDEYKWSGPDKRVVSMLNSFLDPEGPSGSDPNPDATAAQMVVDKMDFKLLRYDKLDYVPGRVY